MRTDTPDILSVRPADPASPEAQALLAHLGDTLRAATGRDGTAHFRPEDMRQPGAVFAVAFLGEEPCGCGGLRPAGGAAAELKRLYAARPRQGIGTALLAWLEARARDMGYRALLVETGQENAGAIRFYLRHGFEPCAPYGPYAGREDVRCFVKRPAGGADTPAMTDNGGGHHA